MNNKHRKTLATVFTDFVSGTVEWSEVEKLLIVAGARVIEGNSSRVRFEKDGEVETFHRSHPAKEAKRYQVRAAARPRGKKLVRQPGQRPTADKVAEKVITAVTEGRSYRWIARDLAISKNTVLEIMKRHRQSTL